MGVSIKCILEWDIPVTSTMEGKSLASAYCGELSADVPDEGEPGDIIAIDFSGASGEKHPASSASSGGSLLSSLTPFMSQDGLEWHSATDGLAAVRGILGRLRDGATVAIDPEFPFANDDEDLTESVQFDLEELEAVLIAAEKDGSRFCLVFDM